MILQSGVDVARFTKDFSKVFTPARDKETPVLIIKIIIIIIIIIIIT